VEDLDASTVGDDDLVALAEGISSIDGNIATSDIDNIVVEQSTRRKRKRQRKLRSDRHRSLASSDATVTFDVSMSIAASIFDGRDDFISTVKTGLRDSVSDGSLMDAIESASDSSTFDGGLSVCCASYTAVIRPTGSPTSPPTSYEESDMWKQEQLDWYEW